MPSIKRSLTSLWVARGSHHALTLIHITINIYFFGKRSSLCVSFTYNAWVMCCNLCSLPQMLDENWHNPSDWYNCPLNGRMWRCCDKGAKVYPNKIPPKVKRIESSARKKNRERQQWREKNNRVQINVWTYPIKRYSGMRIMWILCEDFGRKSLLNSFVQHWHKKSRI